MKSGTAKKKRSASPKPAKSNATSTKSSEPDPQTAEALHQVYLWILAGQHERDIVQAVEANFPDQDARPLIVEALTRLEAESKFSRDVVRGWCFEATRDLYRRMLEIGDFAGALKAIKMIREMT